ncbi:hypothetical protein AAE478_000060 [Parahypoxylon ruwenzoriense]
MPNFNSGSYEEEQPVPQPMIAIEPREPQATNPQLPSLTWLVNEIIAMIADILEETSPNTISSLALHREVLLDHTRTDRRNSPAEKLEFIYKGGILEAIRKLEVRGYDSGLSKSKLYDLLPKTTGLTDVTWSGICVPRPVLQILAEKLSIRLHAEFNDGWVINTPGPRVLGLLEANQNLASLKVKIEYVQEYDCLQCTQSLKRILLSCPNLHTLKIDLNLPRSNGVALTPPDEYCDFGFVDEERPPALEELELGGYPFGSPEENDMDKEPGYPIKQYERDSWADVFVWSQLKVLTTYHVNFALKIMPQLISLKEFCCLWDCKQLKTFYEQVPSSLESIYVAKFQTIGLKGLSRHGSSLKRLTVHQKEGEEGEWQYVTVDAETLIKIRDGCPNIEELSLDLSRDGDWPYEMLGILGRFPSLRSLKIWFELGMGDRDNPIQPYVRFSDIGKLFEYLRVTGKTSRLRKLEIASGSPPDVDRNPVSSRSFWPRYNSTNFVCTLSERGDEAPKGIYNVRCTKLMRERNEYFQKTEAGTKDPNCPFSDEEDFRVARDGPTPLDKWRCHF